VSKSQSRLRSRSDGPSAIVYGDCSAQNGQAAYVGANLLDDGTGLFFAAGRHAGPGRKSPARFEHMGIRLAAITAAVSLPIPGIAVRRQRRSLCS